MVEKLRESAHLLSRHFLVLNGITLLCAIPTSFVQVYLANAAQSPLEAVLCQVLSSLFLLGIYPLQLAALLQALAHFRLGDEAGVLSAYRDGFEAWPRLLWTWFVSNLLVLLGFLCFVLPGIYLAIKYIFVPHVCVLEGLSGRDCRRRSWHLTDGRGVQMLCIYLLFAVPVLLLIALLNLATHGRPDTIYAFLLEVFTQVILLWPFVAIFLHFWEAHTLESEKEVLPEALLKHERDYRLAAGAEGQGA